MNEYTVCHNCAVVLENADTSHIPSADLDSVTSAVEDMGRVVCSDIESGLSFECDCCHASTVGSAYIYERI